MSDGVRFFLNLCPCEDDDASAEAGRSAKVTLFGNEYPKDFRGEIEVEYRVEDDCVKFRVPERNHDVSLGPASEMEAVLIRIRTQRMTIQALFPQVDMIANSACCHGNGCECYAPIGCSC